jgi:hypothetical protein
MSMSKYSQFIKDFIVPFIICGLAIYGNYFNQQLGTVPTKEVELDNFGTLNPLKDLKLLGESASLTLNVQGQAIDNLYIAQARIINKGKNPIVPADYIEPITVSVEKPWKIVAVADGVNSPPSASLRWIRLNDLKFEAKPALLNPGDTITTHIYLTRISGDLLAGKDEAVPNITWSERIVNLGDFYTPTTMQLLTDTFGDRWGINVSLYGWSFVFTVIAALILQTYYLHLLANFGFFDKWENRSIAAILVTVVLSFSCSECLAIYIFQNFEYRISGISHWLNLPPILLSVVTMVFLAKKSKSSKKIP